MNRRKKVLSLVVLLTFLAGWCSLSVFAQPQNAPYFPNLDSSSSKAASSSSAPPPASPAPPPSSSSAPSSSKKSISSKKAKKTSNRVSSSSSEPESSESSFEPSSEESSGIALPSVGSVPENDPFSSAVNNQANSRKLNWLGILSWACIALGIVVVLAVMMSNRRPPRGMGRKRYRRAKRTNKKRLLNDKYYRDLNNRY